MTADISYVYKITNVILNRHYIGSRLSSTPDPLEDILVKYFTSSFVMKKMFEIYDPSDHSIWKVQILKTFDNRIDATSFEDLTLRSIDKHDRINYMNISFHTGGVISKSNRHVKLYDTVKDVYFQFPIGLEIPENCIRKSPPHNRSYLSKYVNPDTHEVIWASSKPDNFMTVCEFDKYQRKLRSSLTTKVPTEWYTDGVNNLRLPIGNIIPDGYIKGRTKKTDSPKKYTLSVRVHNDGKSVYNNGEINVYFGPDDIIPSSFKPGMWNANGMSGKKHSESTILKMKSYVRTGTTNTWTKGKTKDTCEKLRAVSEKISAKMKGRKQNRSTKGCSWWYNCETNEETSSPVPLTHPWIIGRKMSAFITPYGIFASHKTVKSVLGISMYFVSKKMKEFPNEWRYINK